MPSRRDNRVNTRGRNNSQQAEDVTEVGSNQPNNSQVLGNARKRVRGPTFMPKVWTKTDEDRISVQFNEYGQPVDETASTLTHFIGSFARSGKYCKLHKPWNKVKNAKKQILLDTVNRLSDKNKANRAKKKMMQVTGKKSYAQVREKQKEQMEELTSQLSEHEFDDPGPQDIYSKVMGNDKNGTAEMYGLGVRASDVGGVVSSRSARRRDKLQWKSTAERLIYLKSISNFEIVAKGWIRSLDPDEVVGSKEVGPNWCQVDVQVVIKKDEYLVRKYGLFITVQDTIGAPVASPCSFVSVVCEDD
nr:hypothetical protein [Tanacetum cinerariifolium]